MYPPSAFTSTLRIASYEASDILSLMVAAGYILLAILLGLLEEPFLYKRQMTAKIVDIGSPLIRGGPMPRPSLEVPSIMDFGT